MAPVIHIRVHRPQLLDQLIIHITQLGSYGIVNGFTHISITLVLNVS
jgi:hypothetical protein